MLTFGSRCPLVAPPYKPRPSRDTFFDPKIGLGVGHATGRNLGPDWLEDAVAL